MLEKLEEKDYPEAMNTEISLHPIAYVKNNRKEMIDDNWNKVISEIELVDSLPTESLDGIESFSHLEIIYFFDKSEKTMTGREHPRENPNWPKVGIFAQRKKDRPNHLGLTIVNLIEREGRILIVSNLDAIDGTPVLDIKPVFDVYLPKGKVIQPEWTHELMRNYWKNEI
ncbi:MAG: SAM-dependent methyltransferase [Bacteroidales bacterium]|nr:SAM-dependent methyltransferase [Bacteroidales bacterium]MCF8457480.1 SAM-dependent methyltransferase [Bacteroidales bacterium]